MKKICILALFAHLSFANVYGQDIVINELYNASDQPNEWIELLVVKDRLDIRNWNLRDYSSGGFPQSPLVFTSNSLWSNLRAGTIIVITNITTMQEDLDPSDYTLTIRSNNSLYMSGNAFNFAGASDAIQIRNGSQTHVFGVSWGPGNASSIPNPKVHFSVSSTSGTSISYTGGNVDGLTNAANWSFNNATSSRGIGNSSTNIAWIASLSSRADGSGNATVKPDTVYARNLVNLMITFKPNIRFTLNALRIILPSTFEWPRNSQSVAQTNLTGLKSVSGDTISYEQLSFSADSTIIIVADVIIPDSTGYYSILVQTRGTTQFETIMGTPSLTLFGDPAPISDTKPNDVNGVALRLGQLATVRGIVTVANEFGGPSYVQDHSAGMSIFGSSLSTSVQRGDEVVVSGMITQFNGLNQFENPILHRIVSSGDDVAPVLIRISDFKNEGLRGEENLEGKLVRINGVTVRDLQGQPLSSWQVSGSGTNYRLIQGTDTVDIRIDADINLVNVPVPQGPFDVIGVVSQFKTSSPFTSGYQVMPRSKSDILASGPAIATVPKESNITPSSVTITWKTQNPGSSRIRFGRTSLLESGHSGGTNLVTDHSVTLSNLLPATVYYLQAYSVSGIDTSFANTLIVSTSSLTSKGTINVYFNKPVDASVARTEIASGNVALASRFIERISAAKHSIDLAIYNMSGTPGSQITSALVNARTRGVQVRVIGEKDNIYDQTTGQMKTQWRMLTDNQIPLVHDGFDVINAGAGLMHNKFAVFDYADPSSDTTVWSWTGSWNFTDNGTNTDFQNAIEIQDRALAGAFTLEFNEMWGSETTTPNQSKTRFGARKTDNIPHNFVVGGTRVEIYFSPSDRTTEQIIKTVNAANHSANVAMLSFTRSDIANALVARKNAGVKVRIILDNNTDTGNQFNFLQLNGVNILLDPLSAQLHHKYLIVDAEHNSFPGVVLTGSHNWSSSAETRNDENTLIIRSDRVANLYLQEFKARYLAANGTDNIIVRVESLHAEVPLHFFLNQNYPNPFNPTTSIIFGLPKQSRVALTVYDVTGREVAKLLDEERSAGVHRLTWDASKLSSGVYLYRISTSEFVQSKKLLLFK